MNTKKILLTVALSVCFIVAGSKVYKFYKAHQPPFSVGECFQIEDDNTGPIKFKVTDNDRLNAITSADGTSDNFFNIPGVRIQIPIKASFESIRDSNATKVDCE